MWKRTWKYMLAICAALYVSSAALLWITPTAYKVDFGAILEIWGDIARDVDKFTKTATRVSVEDEMAIGDEIDGSIWVRRVTDPDFERYVDNVGQDIAAHARRKGITYKFHIFQSPEINAFAIAGGHIYITTAMLEMLESEAELAAILGHEIAHVDLQHTIELLQTELFLQRAGFGDLAILIKVAEDLVGVGFSEVMEREADRLGMLLAAEAGYSPLASLAVFKKMHKEFYDDTELAQTQGPEGEIVRALSDALEDYFQTHPPFLDRLDELSNLLDNNMTAWAGDRFYLGVSNHTDLVARSDEEREEEFITHKLTSPEYLVARAEIANVIGRTSEALRLYSETIEIDPQNSKARVARIGLYLKVWESEKALTDIDTLFAPYITKSAALEETLDKLSEDNIVEISQVFYEIIQTLKEMIALQTQIFSIMEDLDHSDLNAEQRNLTDLMNRLEDSYSRLGNALLALKNYDDATTAFKNYKTDFPESPAADRGLVLTLMGEGKFVSALKGISQALDKFPEEVAFLSLRADVYELAGQLELAATELKRLRQYVEDGIPYLTDRAWSKYQKFLAELSAGKAMAISDNGKHIATSVEFLLLGSASDEALRLCQLSGGTDCKLYALGNNIVWGIAPEELDETIDRSDSATISPRFVDRFQMFDRQTDLLRYLEEIDNNIVRRGYDLLLLRADVNRRLARYSDALDDIDARGFWVRDQYYSPNIIFFRAMTYTESQKPLQAQSALLRIVRSQLDDELTARSIAVLAGVYLQNDEFAKATELYETANISGTPRATLEIGMCQALARRALPVLALQHCERAFEIRHADIPPYYYDVSAFVYWQLRRDEEAYANLATAKELEPERPVPAERVKQFGNLLVEVFLHRDGYLQSYPDGSLDKDTQVALRDYYRLGYIPLFTSAAHDMIGQITPLGFGKYQINIDDESLQSKFGQICEPATKGEILSIRGNDGVRFLCTPDGTTLRKSPMPISLDYRLPEKTKCFDPERGIAFLLDPDAPRASLGSCGGNSYAIRELDFQRISDELNNVVELPDVELGPFDTEVVTYPQLEAEEKIEAETTGRLPTPEAIRDQGQVLNTEGLVGVGTDFFSQSITAGISGGLAAIEVSYEFNIIAPIQYSIYAGGNPVTGEPLYTELIESPVFEKGRKGVFRWLLPSDRLFFEEGEQFTFAFKAQSSRVIFSASDRPNYISGELFQNGVPSPKADDVAFITYVVPATSSSNKAINEVSQLREAAEQGNADAQFRLGYMYNNGSGVPRDDKEAVSWYRLAAEQGNADGQSNLGYMYQNGYGVPKDDKEAVRWYRLAAAQGYASAQSNLGWAYRKGEGVLQNYAVAVTWYRLAVRQAFAPAQGSLAWMNYHGLGVPQDFIRAHMWYSIAAQNGDTGALGSRDDAASQMDSADIAEALRLARVCVASNYQDCD